MSVKNKQNLKVDFLVRAEFLITRPPARLPAHQTTRGTARPPDRPPLVITIPHSLNG